jgi:hypothetical protein
LEETAIFVEEQKIWTVVAKSYWKALVSLRAFKAEILESTLVAQLKGCPGVGDGMTRSIEQSLVSVDCFSLQRSDLLSWWCVPTQKRVNINKPVQAAALSSGFGSSSGGGSKKRKAEEDEENRAGALRAKTEKCEPKTAPRTAAALLVCSCSANLLLKLRFSAGCTHWPSPSSSFRF